MALTDSKKKATSKRKRDEPEQEQTHTLTSQLEMLTDEEGDDDNAGDVSDDGEYDEFPEIDAESDSEEEDEEEDEEDEEDEPDISDEEDSDSDESLHVFPKAKTVVSDITGQQKRVYPEIEPDYDSDSSTEDSPNRVGNVPMHWYDDLPHIGYDINGKRVLRPAKGDELDKFLATIEDPDSWTSAFDKKMQMDKPLTSEELDIIQRLYAGENPDATYDPYEPMVEWFTGKGKEEIMPLSAAPEPKRRWVRSKWEKQKIMKIVRAIRQGRIVPNKPKTSSKQFEFYSIWSSEPSSSQPPPLPAPKRPLPTNAESYNPPEEYLPTEEEKQEWLKQDPEDRERDFLPQKFSSLRHVPAYDQFIKERFNRQLDLYLAPRIQRVKLNIDPNSLIPKLPSPSSLKPFPNYRSLLFTHPKGRARCVSVSPDGAWAVSGDEDGVVSLWEVNVGCEIRRWKFEGKIGSLEWCPRADACYFAVGIEETIHFLIPPNLDPTVLALTQTLLAPSTLPPAPATPSAVKWSSSSLSSWSVEQPILSLNLPPSSGLPTQISWHKKGDYIATVSSGGAQNGVWIHQFTRRHSQAPFKKIKGAVQQVLFHPIKPHFFVATQQYVRLYNLAEQKLIKTLQPGIRWISSMDVHPSGDHVIVGGYDRKLCWFDLELSEKPYKVLRYHSRAIRSLHFHPTYPLFASSSDDGSIQIFHARVYNDLMTDPLIVPLKILRGHQITDGLGILQVKWTPKHPWLLSAAADGTVAVWCS
ncbi:WD repeat/BOP1NT protein [Coprinopsis cinerea AmutBmut pab1-1]|uniref:Ribosome biogenesis protein ERB1 n=1 Tax=Coprinopsis cinerea (strain Okayama-7 / 130 / ATCC MYA-4618 / FGSC 9003) TaxID=240176 RepID=ERB1_COPC7|nr:RecName: Full=Ribosome biogenesis protein ERB1; AltName: Full=Eukaryotic ribosome biogenesis protein 1 [Coprinopsis cinerea okayama7\